ncbi:MAG TPA: hypothetical protein VMM92_05785 [Thermoanaerobaculia bacterium]|nr:hypothetical protein [Thermoanaerobaculia bacterium]
MSNPFAGKWIYRSYLNEPSMPEFGEGTLSFDDSALGLISGTLWMPIDKPNLELKLRGNYQLGTPFQIRFQGVGVPGTGTTGWIYDYIGYLVPAWPDGVGQVSAIVGSVIRTVAHGAGSPAGVVASFIAVRESLRS